MLITSWQYNALLWYNQGQT